MNRRSAIKTTIALAISSLMALAAAVRVSADYPGTKTTILNLSA
jgi:hypothetical protein